MCLARNRADADDLVQDVYVRALRASRRFTAGTNLKAWLHTILHNVARNERRDFSRARVRADERQLEEAAEHRSSGEPSREEILIGQVLAPELRGALEAMPKSLRDAVWLRDVEGLTYSEIAQQMRIPLGTVMSRISRGRRLLHDRLMASHRSEG